MTNAELKEALFSREPVSFLGTPYDYVSAVIYRTCHGKLYITAELMDEKGNSVTIAHAEKVERRTDAAGGGISQPGVSG